MDKSDKTRLDPDRKLKKPLIGMRWVLVILCHWLYLIAGLQINSLSVTIVTMINATEEINSTEEDTTYTDVCRVSDPNDTRTNEDDNSKGEFFWTASQQGLIFGAYFWGFFIGRVIGGRLAEAFGQRLICGTAFAMGGIMVAISPPAASLNVYCFITCRFLLGLFHGPSLPSIHSLMSRWAPRNKIATMLTLINSGNTIGSTIGFLTGGLIAESIGWRWVFWFEAMLTFAWVPFWFIFVRNDPKDHPYVTPYEANILSENQNVTVKKNVPWKEILTCRYVYVLMFALFARVWSYVVDFTAGPTYFNRKIGINITNVSLIVGVASILGLPSMIIFGMFSDFIISRRYVSKLTGRRILHGIGTIGPAVMFLLLIAAGCNIPFSITIFQLIGPLSTATASSLYVSVIDIAPNYAGTIMGLLGFGNIGGSLAPIVTSYLAVTENGWNKVFYLTAGLNVCNCILYGTVMTADPLPWNYNEEDKSKIDEENI